LKVGTENKITIRLSDWLCEIFIRWHESEAS